MQQLKVFSIIFGLIFLVSFILLREQNKIKRENTRKLWIEKHKINKVRKVYRPQCCEPRRNGFPPFNTFN